MNKIAFTIVLNGMPYIEKQYTKIPKFFDKWYIIEGPALPTKCTSWCKQIPQKYLNNINMSSDGTYEFLNDIQCDQIQVIRPPIVNGKHQFWNGKAEMCNSFIDEVDHAFLMQIDVDEFWGNKTLEEMFMYFRYYCGEKVVQFRCNYYVGEDLILQGKNCYGDMPYEWNRLWIFNEKTKWISHEPPELQLNNPLFINKDFTTHKGWGFRHYAYAKRKHVEFKQDYYGYNGAVKNWERLQNETNFPVFLRDYFPWVNDDSQVIKI
jgi:hypothetical protein